MATDHDDVAKKTAEPFGYPPVKMQLTAMKEQSETRDMARLGAMEKEDREVETETLGLAANTVVEELEKSVKELEKENSTRLKLVMVASDPASLEDERDV